MQFTQIPQQFAPLGGPVRYIVETGTTQNIDIRIRNGAQNPDTPAGELFGAKRFVQVTQADIDIAPCLRRAIRLSPDSGFTGVYPASGRTVIALIEAQSAEPGGDTIIAPARTFICAQAGSLTLGLLTAMPLSRIISEGESDELTLLTDGNGTITVTAQTPETTVAESYQLQGAGLHLFRLNTSDFPGAESLTIDAGVWGVVSYTVVPAPPDGRRIAWRSATGAIEHYTFPVVSFATAEAQKLRAEGVEGAESLTTAYEVRTTLRSAFETHIMLEALAELLAAEQVWQVEGERYTPVDVVTTSAKIHRQGLFGAIEIELCVKSKNHSL